MANDAHVFYNGNALYRASGRPDACLHWACGTGMTDPLLKKSGRFYQDGTAACRAPLASRLAPCPNASRLTLDPPRAMHLACASWPAIRAACCPHLALRSPTPASTSFHWAAASRCRYAHVVTVCFMHFRCMLHTFNGCCKSISCVAYAAKAIHVSCKCMFQMF
jgi:hypothetical protein